MKLEKQGLAIRDATIEDAPLLCRWWNDGKIMAHAGFPRGLGMEEQEIANLLKNDDDSYRHLILEHKQRPIGEMHYRVVAAQTAEIGIKICETDLQNRGNGTKFLQMLIEYLFEKLQFQKIVLDTNLNNLRAQHVYEKLGFQKTAVKPNIWKNQLGELQSSVEYELTAGSLNK